MVVDDQDAGRQTHLLARDDSRPAPYSPRRPMICDVFARNWLKNAVAATGCLAVRSLELQLHIRGGDLETLPHV